MPVKRTITIKDRLDIKDKLLNGKVRGLHHFKTKDGTIKSEPLTGPEFDNDGFTKNLVVYGGREWAFDILFKYPGSNLPTYDILWFGIGEGGATRDNCTVPLYPNDHDLDLYSPVVIDVANNTYGDSGYKKPLNAGTHFKTTNLLAIIYTIYIDFNEGNGSGQTNLNELALYLAPSQSPAETSFRLFSHVCIGTRPKTVNDAYTFEWWIYM